MHHPTDKSNAGNFPIKLLALLIGLAFLLRTWMAALNKFPTVDGTMYLDEAFQLIHNGHLPFSCFPPGWPFLAAVPLLFFSADDPMGMLRAAQIANVLLSTTLLWLTFVFLRIRLGDWLALTGVALMAVLPLNIVLAKSDLSEVAFTCGMLIGWLLFERRRFFSAGLVLGYTYLIRPEALLATLGLAVHQAFREKKKPGRLLLGQLLMMIPYLVFIRVSTGTWDISSKTVALGESLHAHPGIGYLGLVLSNLKLLLPMVPGLIGWPLTLFAMWGIARSRGKWLWLFAPFAPVPFIINPMAERFWLPYVPFFLLAAGLGARDLLALARLRLAWSRGYSVFIVLALVTAAGFVQSSWSDAYMIRRNTESFYGLKDAGLWLRERVDSETVVASYKPYPAYWAGATFLKYPDLNTAAEYAIWARRFGADYLVVNVKVAQIHRPGLRNLLKRPLPPNLADKLKLVEWIQYDPLYHTTAVYKVLPPEARY